MKCEWHRISDYVSSGEIEIRTGPFGTQLRASDYVASGIPVINVRNIGYGTINEEKLEYIDEQTAMRLSMHLLRTNDIVFGRKGAVDRHAFIVEKYNGWLQGSDCIRLRVNTKKLLPQYLSYYFLTKRHKGFMESMCSHGSTMASLNQKILEKIEFPYVSVENQMKIVDVLSAIDRKVMVNRNINANLQQQAQAIFKSWFVDFEPFQDGEFVESELGPIPKGWRVGTLSELVAVKYGKDHKKLTDGPYPVYGSGGIMRYVERPIYTKESVLIPRKGTLNNVIYLNEPFWSVDTMFYTEMKMENVAKYVYHFVSGKDLASMNSGSAVPSMTTDILNSMKVVIPTAEWLEKFEQILLPLYSQMFQNAAQSKTLAQLRDTLLPKLMNGGIEATP